MAYLGYGGGQSIAETVRRILQQLFSHDLALQLNYAGRGDKTGIGSMKVKHLIVGKSFYYSWWLSDRGSANFSVQDLEN